MKLYLQYFGNLTATVDDTEIIPMEKILGNQLTLVFSMLAAFRSRGVSKPKLMDTFWSNSENPTNALKFSVHRLRKILATIDAFKDIDLVVTTQSGYKINESIELVLDFEEFTNYANDAIAHNNLDSFDKAMNLYKGDYLSSFSDIDRVLLDRAHYKVFMSRVAESYCQLLETNQDWTKMNQVSQQALKYDSLNEELIYYYIKSLLKTNQFNDALKYYDVVNKLMHKEYGVELQSKTSQLLSIVSSSDAVARSDETQFKDSLLHNGGEAMKGPLYCDYSGFKKIAQFEVRNSIRLHVQKYLLFISFAQKDSVYNDVLSLIRIIARSLRINDVYTRISNTQVAILCSFSNKSDGYIVAERIMNAYTHKMDNRAQLTYNLMELSNNILEKEFNHM